LNRRQALVWLPACVVPIVGLAYQLHGGINYVHVEALEGLLALDGLILLLISFSPRSKDSLFSKVRNNERDLGMVTLLTFLSALLLTNGLLDLVPLKDGSGLIAGIGIVPGKGLTTLIGIIFLLVAMIALFLLLAREFLEGGTKVDGDRASGVAAADAAVFARVQRIVEDREWSGPYVCLDHDLARVDAHPDVGDRYLEIDGGGTRSDGHIGVRR
jgi:hypothetical protein